MASATFILADTLGNVRKKRLELDKVIESKDGLKQRFDEIVQTINSRDSLLEEFDEEIFNALVEKIEILTPAHFVFEYEKWDEGGGRRGVKIWNIRRAFLNRILLLISSSIKISPLLSPIIELRQVAPKPISSFSSGHISTTMAIYICFSHFQI